MWKKLETYSVKEIEEDQKKTGIIYTKKISFLLLLHFLIIFFTIHWKTLNKAKTKSRKYGKNNQYLRSYNMKCFNIILQTRLYRF